MRRFGRKLDVERCARELPMRAFFFDCLRLDGDDARRPPDARALRRARDARAGALRDSAPRHRFDDEARGVLRRRARARATRA